MAAALDDGAHIETRDGRQRTALLLAATFDHAAAELLVERGPIRTPSTIDMTRPGWSPA
ncbi:MAG: hypothetical protein R2749_13345 [Acidimicrobiales bacterium]